MPNYCSNKLVIKGSKAALAKFAATLGEGGEFLLAQTHPVPEEITGISCGGCHINGKMVANWRVTADGKSVEISAKELSALKRKYGATNWYDWCIGHWGTKWDVTSDTVLTVGEKEIYGWFDTAWAPPVKWLVYVSKEFPTLTFTLYFSEGGVGFYGSFSAKNGSTKDSTKEDFWKDSDPIDSNDSEDYDPESNLTKGCKEFIHNHGLHIGG
jgi:hypothetical protein